MKKKNLVIGIIAAVLLIVSLGVLQRLLMPKFMTGIVEGSLVEEYYQEKSKHDVIFVGDCEVYENFSPITLWKNYGITSYIRGSAQQLIWQSYYLLEDTLRFEKPDVVVFNVLSLKYDQPQSEAYNRMSIDGMQLSMAKINNILASMTPKENILDYIFPILRYHSRITSLTADDFKYCFGKDKVSTNGYYMRVDVKPAGVFPTPKKLADYNFGANAMKYLDKMTLLCKQNGIKLILIKAPCLYPYWYKEWDDQVKTYAKKNNLDYINMINLVDKIGIDFKKNTYDAGLHLNLSGAEKLADYFGAYLVRNYALKDHRGDPILDKIYNDKTAFYNDMKQSQIDEIKRYGYLKRFLVK
ncbi:MAG: SGNH/GDSL hydrolase family protein [Clostridia bacterium]|jgi:hypothetical protein